MVHSFKTFVFSVHETYHSSLFNSVEVFAHFKDSKKMNLKSYFMFIFELFRFVFLVVDDNFKM
jgi:hypothetical protein